MVWDVFDVLIHHVRTTFFVKWDAQVLCLYLNWVVDYLQILLL